MLNDATNQKVILDSSVRALVQEIETHRPCLAPNELDPLFRKLILTLKANCADPQVQARYSNYRQPFQGALGSTCLLEAEPYPTDSEGYAVGFDPLEDENAFLNAWMRYGFVVGRSVVPKSLCDSTLQRIEDLSHDLSAGKFKIDQPSTHAQIPQDADGTPLISRGFFEIYHDDSLAQLRQALRVYLHHVVLWGRADLWTSFDRFGVKLAGHPESKGLPLHVDQNPKVHPHFETLQGVLALTDCPIERGTYVAVPGSRRLFHQYVSIVDERKPEYLGEYVELPMDTSLARNFYALAQPIPIRAGDLITWDSRTTHANSANESGKTRMVAYLAASPARETNASLVEIRKEAFQTGLGSNVRDAYLHASMRPRFTDPTAANAVRQPERLHQLGRLLYGQETYETLD